MVEAQRLLVRPCYILGGARAELDEHLVDAFFGVLLGVLGNLTIYEAGNVGKDD